MVVSNKKESFIKLEEELLGSSCVQPFLGKSAERVVMGVGDYDAKVMLVGEAPGANEDKQGLPFVGRAGILLNKMLRSIDLDREKFYITNILKCRPPQNRTPAPSEIKACMPFLSRQIHVINPQLIVALGRIAAQALLSTQKTMAQLRGYIHFFEPNHIPLVVTFHPAYLLRVPGEKPKAQEDWLLIKNKWVEIQRNAMH